MALEDFEKSLAEDKEKDQREKLHRHREEERKHRRHHRHHHRDRDGQHRKRRDHSADRDERESRRKKHRHHDRESADEELLDDKATGENIRAEESLNRAKRDSWMEPPSSLDVEYKHNNSKKPVEPALLEPQKKDFHLKIHDNELNKHHLQDLADGKDAPEEAHEEATREVNYTIGDAGSQWRMKKLKRVYERAEEERRAVEDVAAEQFGDLRSFDDAREEQIELERRSTYGSGYVGKEKPNGDLFAERKLDMGVKRGDRDHENEDEDAEDELDHILDTKPAPEPATTMDQTTLNRLKAQMMKAKLRGGPQAAALEAEYNTALSNFSTPAHPPTHILNPMEARLLSANTSNEVTPITNTRGRERGLVKPNAEMSIDDMVREEKRNRNHQGGSGYQNDSARYAARIAKDGKFSSSHEYLDENASALAQPVHKSSTTLRASAIAAHHTHNKPCTLCLPQDSTTPPSIPLVSLATRTYLTLPPHPPLHPLATTIAPLAHHPNLLSCDDDEWEELRNFQKSLTRYYASLRPPLSVLFYESASHPTAAHHAVLHAVPLPPHLHALAPQFFKEAILAADEEWSQHRKIIDTLALARKGKGKGAFRAGLVREVPYFHVWFEVDGGIGHVVEDAGRWPRGDGFARGVLGGVLGLEHGVVRKEGRWGRGAEKGRVEEFREGWGEWDWTKVLLDGEGGG